MSKATRKRLPRALRWDALDLQERLSLLDELRLPVSATSAAEAKGRQLVDLILPGEAQKAFDAWLESNDGNPARFAAANEFPVALVRRSLPVTPWQELADSILSPRFVEESFGTIPPTAAPTVFLLLRPFSYWASKHVDEIEPGLPSAWGRARLHHDLIDLLMHRLIRFSRRTLYLEVNVQALKGQLTGSTSQELSAAFVRRNGGRAARTLFLRYPVLCRLLANACLDWRRNIRSLAEAYGRDRTAIVETIFEGRDPGRVMSIQRMGSDPHAGGKEVLVLKHEAGNVLFKPRDLHVDVAFAALLEWFNGRGVAHRLSAVRVLPRDEYGWAEYIEAAETTADGCSRFYYRQGVFVALLHLLYATDFHSENLIAAGEYPYLVDLEALFHAKPDFSIPLSPGLKTIHDSVIRTGLLPMITSGSGENPGVDFSGLGNPDGQMSPDEIEVPDESGDTPSIVKRRMPIETRKNRPVVHGNAADVFDFETELVAGFTDAITIARADPNAFTAALDAFRGTEVRQIVRSTRSYDSALTRSWHPDYLRDAVAQEVFLSRFWLLALAEPAYARTVAAEISDMRHGDVPKFTSIVGSLDLRDSGGHRISGHLGRTALERAHERFHRLDAAELSRQQYIIHSSLVSLKWLRQRDGPPRPASSDSVAEESLPTNEFVDEAIAIARGIADGAIRDGDAIDWIALNGGANDDLRLGSIGDDLYGGAAGIAVFLAYLGRVAPTQEFEPLFGTIVRSLRKALPSSSAAWWGGAFNGPTSVLFALRHVTATTDDEDLMPAVIESAVAVANGPLDSQFDLLAGSAGVIAILASLYRQCGDSRLLEGAIRFGDHLLAAAEPQAVGIGWRPAKVPITAPLTGAAHGASGIAWALGELEQLAGDRRFGDAARAALQYEDSAYLDDEGNWRDFRILPERLRTEHRVNPWGWCHGGPGIALLRTAMLNFDARASHIEKVLRYCAEKPLASSDCLCHGELGNTEALVAFGLRYDRRDYLDVARRRASAAIRRRRRTGLWQCGVAYDEIVPGIFVGTAGIGLQLLRIAFPDRVPSVLSP